MTVRTDQGLFRIAPAEIEALGPDIVAEFEGGDPDPPPVRNREPFGEETVWNALRQCYDPEIPINIVDLGLIYDLRLGEREEGGWEVFVKMTLTAQGCGMGPTIAADARSKIESLPDVTRAEVEIVWDPQWTPNMISEDGRKVLGID